MVPVLNLIIIIIIIDYIFAEIELLKQSSLGTISIFWIFHMSLNGIFWIKKNLTIKWLGSAGCAFLRHIFWWLTKIIAPSTVGVNIFLLAHIKNKSLSKFYIRIFLEFYSKTICNFQMIWYCNNLSHLLFSIMKSKFQLSNYIKHGSYIVTWTWDTNYWLPCTFFKWFTFLINW